MQCGQDFDFAAFTAADDANLFLEDSLDLSNASTFEAINDPVTATASAAAIAAGSTPLTVSPHDVLLDSMSAPPSTTLTNLTTPGTSTYESPWMANSSETSPLFGDDELGEGAKDWPSLFEPMDDMGPQAISMTHSLSTASTGSSATGPISYFPANDAQTAYAKTTAAPALSSVRMVRNDSCPGFQMPARSVSGRHSAAIGVASRKRDKPLPAITVEDPQDTIAVKRARNTMAARKSRQKRMEHVEQLEDEISDLAAQVDHWKTVAIAHGYTGQ